MKRALLLACLALSMSPAANAAGQLRCKGRIIRVGVPAAYVLSQCGQPENQVVEAVTTRARTSAGFSRISGVATSEQWIYDRGWGKFPAVLYFVDGTLKRIDSLPHRSDRSVRVAN